MHISEKEFNDLLLAHIPFIKKAARRYMTNDKARHEELVQIAALYVLEHREQYNPALGKFGTWLRYQLMGAWGGAYKAPLAYVGA